MALDEISKDSKNDSVQNNDRNVSEICLSKKMVFRFKRKITESSDKEIKMQKVQGAKPQNQCKFCSKKIKAYNTYQCRCGGNFCNKHRFFDQHNCTYDYQADAKKILEKNNPKVAPKKL